MVEELANSLADHLIQFCLSERRYSRTREPLSPAQHREQLVQHQKLGREARGLLRRIKNGGEAGEILLYFLMEAVLKAPQVVCKMEMKGNPGAEVLGSDGVHMKWDSVAQVYDVYFGESKLVGSMNAALSSAVKSIEKFHRSKRAEGEIRLVTSQFKYLDDNAKRIAAQLAYDDECGAGLRTNHACLIGFDSDDYDRAKGNHFREIEADFARSYESQFPKFGKAIVSKFGALEWTASRFEIFVLPMPAVAAFRDAFLKAVNPDD